MESLFMDGWKMVDTGSAKELFSFMVQACNLVHIANMKGVRFTHRDFHPGNIMCKRNGGKRLKLFNKKTIKPKYRWLFIDFGMSCVSKLGSCAQKKGRGTFLPPQDETPYAGEDVIFCNPRANSQYYDMRLFFHACYDSRDEMPKKVQTFMEEWLDDRFEDTPGWHDSYAHKANPKNTRKDKKMFSPAQCMKQLVAGVRKYKIKL